MEKTLFGMGNPLLDISASVSFDLITKYNLKENDAILAEEKHLPIFEELINNYDVQYIPGGATQNAIKVAQWILKKKYASVYVGCVKADSFGKILHESCEKIGVKTLYQYNEGPEPTGVCACLITGHNRSLVTNLGSSCKFTVDHLDNPEIWKFVEESKIFYISSFFITSCHEALIRLANYSLINNKTFCLNLGAEFLVEFFHVQVMEAIEYADIVFGNETEALKMSKICNFNTTDISKIALNISNLPFKKKNQHRKVIITQGSDPIIVIHGGQIKKFPVLKLKPESIVDTNGAGDAFVGGFLAQLLHEKSLEECVRCGMWAAEIIIQQPGCTFPEVCSYS